MVVFRVDIGTYRQPPVSTFKLFRLFFGVLYFSYNAPLIYMRDVPLLISPWLHRTTAVDTR